MSTDERLNLLGWQADELFRLAARVFNAYWSAAAAGHGGECDRLARLHRHYREEHEAVHLEFKRQLNSKPETRNPKPAE